MATDDKQRILDWCSADSDVRCVEEDADEGAEFTLRLASGGAEVTATLPTGGDRLVLRSVVDLDQATHPAGSGDLAADLVELEERRPGPVTASLDPAGEQVVISTWIVLDGLTKHSLLTAVSDLHRTWGAVLRLTGVTAEASATGVQATEVVGVAGAEEDAPVPAIDDAAADSASVAGGVSDATPSTWAWSPAGASAAFAAVGEAGAPEDAAAAGESAVPEDTAAPKDAATSEYEPVPEYTPAPEADTAPEAAPEAESAGSTAYPEPAYPAAASEAAPEAATAEVEAVPEAEAAPDAEAAPAPRPWVWPSTDSATELAAADASPGTPGTEQEEPSVAEPSVTGAAEQAPVASPWGATGETTFEPLASPYHPLDSPGQSYPESTAPIEFEATPGPLAQATPTAAGGSGQGYGTPFTPEAVAVPAPAPAPAQPAWTPGHKVPPQGMQAWAAPDPAGAVVATLGGHLPVQVTEVRGAWAHVLCSNGWTGWVDNRLLVVGA
ncbi:MAG: SH3 domain-containing protein [Candidatus Dormibacteria bacterium]|jgi:hypothetical protein